MYILVYQNNKKYQGGGGPLCPARWPPLPKLLHSRHFIAILRQFDINKTSTCQFHIILTSNRDEMPAGAGGAKGPLWELIYLAHN